MMSMTIHLELWDRWEYHFLVLVKQEGEKLPTNQNSSISCNNTTAQKLGGEWKVCRSMHASFIMSMTQLFIYYSLSLFLSIWSQAKSGYRSIGGQFHCSSSKNKDNITYLCAFTFNAAFKHKHCTYLYKIICLQGKRIFSLLVPCFQLNSW